MAPRAAWPDGGAGRVRVDGYACPIMMGFARCALVCGRGAVVMPATARSDKTVLVVEDIASAREALALVLRRHGYTVLAAEHGRRALDLLEAGAKPDLILLDMLMPVLDGWHLLQELRRLPGPAPPVVV